MEEQSHNHIRRKFENEATEFVSGPGAGCPDLFPKQKEVCVMDVYAAETTLPRPIHSRRNYGPTAGEGESRQRIISTDPWPHHSWGDCWPHVVLLREALRSSAPEIAVLGPLNGCFSFYKTHLHNQVLSSTYAKTMFLGANLTPLESAFTWCGGWRPTSALVLVYSLMSIEIEDALDTVRNGRNLAKGSTASLLSTRQLSVMQMLQKHTQHTEMKIAKKLSVLQMLIGDQDMLEAVLLDAVSPIAGSSRFRRAMEKRMSRFRRVVVQAEELRLQTLQHLLSLLTPLQAARCGVAVFEICSSICKMGNPMPPHLCSELPIIGVLPVPSSISCGVVDGRIHPLAGFLGPCRSFDAPSIYHNLMNPTRSAKRGPSDESTILVPSCSSSFPSPLLQLSSSLEDSAFVSRTGRFLSTASPQFGSGYENGNCTSDIHTNIKDAASSHLGISMHKFMTDAGKKYQFENPF